MVHTFGDHPGAAVSVGRPARHHKQSAPVGRGRVSSDKERVAAVGIDPTGYSGHSLRAGLATSAAQAGAPAWKIRQQTGHASDAMLVRYIRDGELFTENVAGVLL
jgi:integrase